MAADTIQYARRFRWLGSRGSAREVSRRRPRLIGMPLLTLLRALLMLQFPPFAPPSRASCRPLVSHWTQCNTRFIILLWSTFRQGARLRAPNLVRMSSCRAMQHACGRIFMHTVSFGLWALGRRSPFCFGPGITVPSTIACVPRLRNAVLNFANCVVIGSLLPLGLLLSMATSGNSIRLCVCWRLKDPSVAFSCVRAAHRCRLSEN